MIGSVISLLVAPIVHAAAPASAPLPPWTTVPPFFYSEIVQKSDVIVSGTVIERESRYENGRATIRTYVKIAELTFHKGVARETLTLRFEGGQIGDDRLVVPGMPNLTVGNRYLLYVDGTRHPENVSPIVGFHQGAFQITRRDGREVLLDMSGRELIGVQDDRFVFRAIAQHEQSGRPEAPRPLEEDRTVQLADPAVDAIEARLIEDRARAAAAQPVRPLPELSGDRGAAPVGSESAPPSLHSAGAAASRAERDRALATPIVLDANGDPGMRYSVRDLLNAASGVERR